MLSKSDVEVYTPFIILEYLFLVPVVMVTAQGSIRVYHRGSL